MLVSRILFVFTFIIFSQASKGGLTHQEIVKNYTIERLDAAANLLMVAVDQGLAGKDALENVCGIKKDDALVYINELKALTDAKFVLIKEKKMKAQVPVTWLRCQTACHCGVYERYIETLDLEKLSADDHKRYKAIQELASKMKPTDVKRCVSVSRWFCKSPLYNYLKKQTHP